MPLLWHKKGLLPILARKKGIASMFVFAIAWCRCTFNVTSDKPHASGEGEIHAWVNCEAYLSHTELPLDGSMSSPAAWTSIVYNNIDRIFSALFKMTSTADSYTTIFLLVFNIVTYEILKHWIWWLVRRWILEDGSWGMPKSRTFAN